MNRTNLVQKAETSSLLPHTQGILQRKCSCGNKTVAGGECTGCAKKKNNLQRKLAIGASNDPLEREADRVADQVMSMSPNSSIARSTPKIQRASTSASGSGANVPASVSRVLSSPGSPLELALRQDMEHRFSQDFSQVRVHTGVNAEQSARDVNARAYTVGNNIVLGTGKYSSGSNAGKKLFAHELTHIVQQNGNSNVIQRLDGDPTRVEITYDATGVLETRSILRVCDNGIIHFNPHGSAHISNFSSIRHDDGELTTITPESLRTLYAAIGMQPISCPVERGDACSCDPSTHEVYNSGVISFIRSLKSMILAQARRKAVPPTAIAGAIADEYRTREFPRSILDFIQDNVLDSLSEWQIDIDRFFDFDSKLLNAMENDVGPANINVRTATQMVEEEGLVVPNSPQSNIRVSEIIDFLLTNAGTIETTAVVIRRAKNRFDPYLWAYSPVSYDSILVEYFKQGDSYYRRSLVAITANPDHEICTGDGGCRVIYNYSRLSQALV